MIKAYPFLFLFLFLIQPFITLACYSASQHRMFPIAVKNKHLLVLETELRRDNRYDEKANTYIEFEKGWQGALLLRSYTLTGKKLKEFLITGININDADYEIELKAYLKKGLRFAKKKYGKTVPLTLDYLSFCDFAIAGEKVKVFADSLLNKTFIIDNKTKNEYDISYLNDTLKQSRELIESTYFEEKSLSNVEFGYNLHLSSVRIFTFKARRFLFIQVGNGQFSHDSDGNAFPEQKEYKKTGISPDQFLDLAYVEPILHHGNGFDFFILLK